MSAAGPETQQSHPRLSFTPPRSADSTTETIHEFSSNALEAHSLSEPTREQVEAILSNLYEVMSTLNRKRRLGNIGASDLAFLEEVKIEIDRWEVFLRDRAGKPEVRERLEELAERVLAAVSGKNV